MGTCKLSNEAELQLIEGYKSGKSFKTLGMEFGIGSTTARSIIVRHGVEQRVSYNKKGVGVIPEDQIPYVIEVYKKHLSLEKASIETGYKPYTIRYMLIREGVELNKQGPKTRYDTSTEQEICRLYNDEKYTLAKLGEMYDMDDTSILGILRRYEVKSRKTKENKYHLDEHFFDRIDDERKAYFFGFLFADGNVASDSPSIVMSLQEEDKYMLETLNSFVSTDRPLTLRSHDGNPKHKLQYQLNMYSNYMRSVLISYGMVPAKSLVKKFPQVILNSPEDIIRHFIRGYFDGNGHVRLRIRENRNYGYYTTVSIVSTQEMCVTMQSIFKSYAGVTSYVRKHSNYNDSNTYVVIISANKDVKLLLEWLYKNSNYYLNRKWLVSKKIVEMF